MSPDAQPYNDRTEELYSELDADGAYASIILGDRDFIFSPANRKCYGPAIVAVMQYPEGEIGMNYITWEGKRPSPPKVYQGAAV